MKSKNILKAITEIKTLLPHQMATRSPLIQKKFFLSSKDGKEGKLYLLIIFQTIGHLSLLSKRPS